MARAGKKHSKPAKRQSATALSPFDVIRAKLMEAYEVRGAADVGIAETVDQIRAIETLAGEFSWQCDDGPGKQEKRRAIVSAIAALAKESRAKLQAAHERLDNLDLIDVEPQEGGAA